MRCLFQSGRILKLSAVLLFMLLCVNVSGIKAEAYGYYRIYSDTDNIRVMQPIEIYWEEYDSKLVYLIAEYEGIPVWKTEIGEIKDGVRLAFDKEGKWQLYFLLEEAGGIRSGKADSGSLELMVTKSGEDFLEWNPKLIKYGKDMFYFSWQGSKVSGAEVSVSDKKKGEYIYLGEIGEQGFWLSAKEKKYVKLRPYVLLNGKKFYGKSRELKTYY